MAGRWSTGVVVAVLASVLGAPEAARAGGAASPSPPPADLRNCTNEGRTLGPLGPVRSDDVLLGPVIFYGLGRIASRRGFAELVSPGDRGIKAPLFLPVGAKVTLAVGGGPRRAVRLGYVKKPTRRAVRIEACKAALAAGTYGSFGKVSVFPGAIEEVRPRRCVELVVWLDGQSQPLRRQVSFGAGRCSRSVRERAVERGIEAFTSALRSGRLDRFCALLLPPARSQQDCGTNNGDLGPALTIPIKRAQDVRLLWTQGARATVEIPPFEGRRNFARMRRVRGTWRVSSMYLERPCNAALTCT